MHVVVALLLLCGVSPRLFAQDVAPAPADAALALVERWKRPPADVHELARLEDASRGLQDVRLIGPLQRIASDTGAARVSRIAALSTLLSYLHSAFGLPLDERAFSGRIEDFRLRVTMGSDPRQGGQPITGEDRRRIVAWILARSLSDPDPGVRRFLDGLPGAGWDTSPRDVRCGTLRAPEARLARLARYFRDPEYAEFRDDIAPIAPTDTQEVVTDSRVCARVMEVAANHLRTEPAWGALQRDGFEFDVLRYGPYYAVVIVDLPPPGTRAAFGWARMLILRASDLAVIGIRLV